MSLEVFLLGAPRFARDGVPLALGRRKVIALAAYLLVSRQAHSRDYLASIFWPDTDSVGARANLRKDISRLRQAFGEDSLVLDGDQVSANPAFPIHLDINEFLHSFDRLQAHGHTYHPESPPLCDVCAAELKRAIDLYRGDFLSGFSLPDAEPFEEWLFFTTEELRRKLAEGLQYLITWYTRAADYEAAIGAGRRWVALDVLHEPAHRSLMQLYAWTGQQAAALRQYQELSRLLKSELHLEPEAASRTLFEAIQIRRIATPPAQEAYSLTAGLAAVPTRVPAGQASTHHNLPPETTLFVGREKELEILNRQLSSPSEKRLVTLMGPGGSGKTRLSLAVARSLANNEVVFPDGVWFVPLAAVGETTSLFPEIAQAVGYTYPNDEGNPRQHLISYLSGKRMLLILDNFEQLVGPPSQAFLGELLRAAPYLRLLVTSRVRINIHEENLFKVEGLPVPPAEATSEILLKPGAHREYSSLELFRSAAERVQPNFSLDSTNLMAMMHICRLVQGMPLAIELAASWLAMLTPAEIAAEIERSFDFLETDWFDMPERQRSLRAVFNTSWKYLDEAEKKIAAGLSVFWGSFSREAALSVTGADLRQLLQLVNKSFLQRTPEGRFAIHELLRQYAFEKLGVAQGELTRVRTRHATYYADFLAEQNQTMKGPGQSESFRVIQQEFDNIRAAWNWMHEQGQLEMMAFWMLPALFRYCEANARAFELLTLIDRARSRYAILPEDVIERQALAILFTAQASFYQTGYPVRYESYGMFNPANRQAVEQAWLLAGDGEGMGAAGAWWVTLAYLYGRIVDADAGVQYVTKHIERFRKAEMRWEIAYGLQVLGQLNQINLNNREMMEKTDAYLTEAIMIFQDLGDGRETGHTLRALGNLRRLQGLYGEAIECWEGAQTRLAAAGDWTVANDIHWQIGDVLLDQGEFEHALDHYREMSNTYAARGYLSFAGRQLSKESYEAVRYGDLPRALFTRLKMLEYVRQANDVYGESWGMWELGEYYRVAGDPVTARATFDQALALFNLTGDRNGQMFYIRALADLAFDSGDFAGARRQYEQACLLSRETDHFWSEAYAQIGLGRSFIHLGELILAAEELTGGLRLARRTTHTGLMLTGLAGLAEYHEAAGQPERAVFTAAFLCAHHATWFEVRRRMESLLERLYKEIAQERYTSAFDKGKERSLAEMLE